jgi:hypothetical protein
MAETTLKGRHLRGGVRPSKVTEGVRICVDEACATKLSRYNKRDHCNIHAPVTYPRVRGRFVTESA